MNKKQMDSLHDLRDTTRAHVMASFTENKRETADVILVNENENKSSIQDAEINWLMDELHMLFMATSRPNFPTGNQ